MPPSSPALPGPGEGQREHRCTICPGREDRLGMDKHRDGPLQGVPWDLVLFSGNQRPVCQSTARTEDAVWVRVHDRGVLSPWAAHQQRVGCPMAQRNPSPNVCPFARNISQAPVLQGTGAAGTELGTRVAAIHCVQRRETVPGDARPAGSLADGREEGPSRSPWG